ncbi:MAG: hypothetical protein J6M59_10745 [Bacteroidaceae bacterium]|nr:hypothetical protein [Bacteroidaceae bacterium]
MDTIFSSSWYANANARLLFQHILTHVVYSEKGIYETNYSVICKETGLTMMALRIALKKLEGVVTIKQNNTKRNTKMLFTISDLGIINNTKNNTKGGISPPTTQRTTQRTTQKDAEKSGSYGTSTTQRTTQRTTSRKEEIECLPPAPPTKDKEEKIVEVVDNISVRVRGSAQDGGTPSAKKALMMMNDILERNGLIVESAMRQHHLTKDQLSYWMAKFYDHIVLTCHGEYPNERQLMTHFWCWYNKKQEYLKTQKDAENRRITERKQYLTADEKRQLGYLVYERDFNIKMGLPVNPDTERKINAILNGNYDSLYGEQVH